MQTFSVICYKECNESSYQVGIFQNPEPEFVVPRDIRKFARFDAWSKDEIDNCLYNVGYSSNDVYELCDELANIADVAINIDNIFIKMLSFVK